MVIAIVTPATTEIFESCSACARDARACVRAHPKCIRSAARPRAGIAGGTGLHVLRPKSSRDPRTHRVTACRMIGNLNTAFRILHVVT
eukprot:COSAG02_NODE_31941_length_524_cov_24.901176_1_plen_87_part_10